MVFHSKIIKVLVIDIKRKSTLWLLIKENKYFNTRFKKSNKVINLIYFNINF